MKKTVIILSLSLAATVFVGCRSNKHMALPSNDLVEYELPCGNFDRDTPDTFTGLGTAENVNEQNARSAALKSAKAMIHDKVGGMAKGLSTDYSKAMRGNAAQTDMSSIIEGEIVTVIERMLNDAEKTCERNFKTGSGTYKAYIAISISKKDLAQNVSSALSENDKLRMNFDRELFRKYAEEYMKGLNEQGR